MNYLFPISFQINLLVFGKNKDVNQYNYSFILSNLALYIIDMDKYTVI